MKKIIILIVMLSFILIAAKEKDSVDSRLKSKIEILENQVKEVRRDQLNYSIEKNLLKETYSNNYERISLVITIILGIIGLFGYLGLKDINSIKKQYYEELERLNVLKTDFIAKSSAISETQIKYEKEISEIILQNEEQNKKIKILEFMNKIRTLKREKKHPAALELCIQALEIDPKNIEILLQKSLIYTITRSYNEAIESLLNVLEIEPKNQSGILNLSEVYLFVNKHEDSQKLIDENDTYFNTPAGKDARIVFSALKLFNQKKLKDLIEEIKSNINYDDLNNKHEIIKDWNLAEAKNYIEYKKTSKQKIIMENYLNYLSGEINGSELLEKLN